jgi:hypothetical protein
MTAPERYIYAVEATTPDTADTLSDSVRLATEAQPVPQSATLNAMPSIVDVGSKVTLSGTLSRPDGQIGGVELTLAAHDGAAAARLITATTADDGSFTVYDEPATVGTTTYTFMPDPQQHYADLATATQVTVRPIQPHLRLALRHAWRNVRGLPAFRAGTGAAMVAHVTPRSGAMCVRFGLERHTAQGWKRIGSSGCRNTSAGRARWTFTGPNARPGFYRVRAVSRADLTHTAAHSTRLRFRIVHT